MLSVSNLPKVWAVISIRHSSYHLQETTGAHNKDTLQRSLLSTPLVDILTAGFCLVRRKLHCRKSYHRAYFMNLSEIQNIVTRGHVDVSFLERKDNTTFLEARSPQKGLYLLYKSHFY